MISYEEFYREMLYPFQDGILSIVRGLKTPFYLTGGTALSRHYYNHRYSDDLDIFVNDDDNYSNYINMLHQEFVNCEKQGHFTIDYKRQRKSRDYTQLYLGKKFENDVVYLKIDIVNDISVHYGDFESSDVLGKVDSWRNILSNKLSAIFRYEAKDFADIWIISKSESFNWQDIVEEAKTKETGIDPITIFEILKSFPTDVLQSIKWIQGIDENLFKNDLSRVAEDILKGSENSLLKNHDNP
jgi:hypothetical protein